jgi:hypothetical protein
VSILAQSGPTGPDPKLSAAQLAKVEQALLQGARANEFDTNLWTLAWGRGGDHPAHRGSGMPAGYGARH